MWKESGKQTPMPMLAGKYVVGRWGLILFPASYAHAGFAAFGPISAGFFSVSADGNVTTYEESVSLKLAPALLDDARIDVMFRPS